jgi:hypothetical protein
VGSRVYQPIVEPTVESGLNEQGERLASLLAVQAPERVDALFDEVLMPTPKKSRRKKKAPEPIGDVLRAEIRRRGLSGYELGKLAGIAPDSVQRWLSGQRSSMSLKTVERLVVALDLVLVPREKQDP